MKPSSIGISPGDSPNPGKKIRVTSRFLIKAIGVYSIIVIGLISILILTGSESASERAIIKMALGLILIWIVIGGSLMVRFQDQIRNLVLGIRLPWGLKFFIFCAALALLEEAVTVSMTNLAPLFGTEVGEAFITASDNYLHTVLFHSVIVFLPMFLVWSLLLRFFDFNARQVFLLFGLTGSLAEMSMSPTNVLGGFWFFVYGLMIYLPAYSLPSERGAKEPSWWAYPLAALAPLLAPILLLPLAPVLQMLWETMDPVFFVDSAWD